MNKVEHQHENVYTNTVPTVESVHPESDVKNIRDIIQELSPFVSMEEKRDGKHIMKNSDMLDME